MADSANNLIIDPDDLDFSDENGNIESMTDPETGEVVKGDPAPATREARGPYDDTDDNGDKAGDEDGGGEGEERGADGDELDPLLADTLAVYGLDDDAIEWNGEETRVRDLSPEDRKEFLQELKDSAVREAAELTEYEQELLEFVRAGGNLRELVGAAAPAGTSSIAALSADEVNLADIRQQFPALSDDEVQEELADRKLSARYEAKTGQIRERLTQAEQVAAEQAEQAAFETERQQFVAAAAKMTNVLGFPVTAEVQEFLLSQTATHTESGESPFLESLTPEKILRLQYLDSYADKIDEYYQTEIKAAEKRGYQRALTGAPTSPSGRGGSAGNAKASNRRDERQYADYTLGE